MGGGIRVWKRGEFVPGGGPAQIFFVLFSGEPSPPNPKLSRSRHGIPSAEPLRHLDIATLSAEDDRDGWIRGWYSGGSGELAELALGPLARRLPKARFCHRINGEVPDPPDLGYLQAAWGAARLLLESGSFALLDAPAGRWLSSEAVLAQPPGRPFDLGREISLILETEESPGRGHIVHTRGLAKFGRPDLMIPGMPKEQADAAEAILNAIAGMLAGGRLMKAGETVSLEGGPPLLLQAYRPGKNAPQVHLNNQGLLVTDCGEGRKPLKGIDRFAKFYGARRR